MTLYGNAVEGVTEFCYLGSIQSSSGRSRADILRRIGIASSAMHSMQRVWRQRILSLSTKLRLYQTCVLPILLYGSEIWTLLAEDSRRLQSFHMSCQRMIMSETRMLLSRQVYRTSLRRLLKDVTCCSDTWPDWTPPLQRIRS